MAFVGVPFIGWGLAAWTAVDLVQTGGALKDLYNEYDALDKIYQKCLSTPKAPEKKSSVNGSNGGRGKGNAKQKADCGDVKGYSKSQKEDHASNTDKYERQGKKVEGTEKAKLSGSTIEKAKAEGKLEGKKFQKVADFDRDHLPAKKLMVMKAQTIARKKEITFNDCMRKAIMAEAPTIMVPKDMHRMGKSYGQNAKDIQVSGDLKRNMNDVMKDDMKSYENLMDKQNPTNKKGENLSPDEKKKMGKMTKDCKGKIKQGLRKMKDVNFDGFLDDVLDKFDDNCNK